MPPIGLASVLLLLATYLIAAWGFALPMPFISDDYRILARVRDAGFGELWSAHDLPWRWYRPWSRELHFAAVFRAFGANPLAFHAASFVVWLGVVAAFFTLARRVAGARAAALACAGLAAMSAWSGALLWAAGVQELWLLLWAMLYLHAVAQRAPVWALIALAWALLSKETAGALPAIALAWVRIVDRDSWGAALRRVMPSVALCAVWVTLHPTLLDRVLRPESLDVEVATHTVPRARLAVEAVLGLVNATRVPAPEGGWSAAFLSGLAGIVVAVAFAAWAAWSRPGSRESTRPSSLAHGRVVALGVAWALLAWAPLLLPSIDWHPYYALLGAAGAWLALGAALERTPALAVGLIALAAVLQPLQGNTNVWSFSGSLYQRRQAYFVGQLRESLLATHPRLPSHARLWFAHVPHGIGLGHAWFEPAFEVWYGDSTIRGGFWSAYRPRVGGAPAGPDLFFRYDSAAVRWTEVVAAPEDSRAAVAANPRWHEDHRELAATFARAEDWPRAAAEFGKLAAAFPDSVDLVMSAGVSAELAADSAAAARWYAIVAAHPRAVADDATFAREFPARLRVRRASLE